MATLTAEEFVAKLRSMAAKVREMDHRPALDEVVPEVHQSITNNFQRQVDHEGNHWPPRKDTLPHPLLLLTLAMSTAATGGPGAVVDVDQNELRMGVDKEVVPYAATHHAGSEKRNIPRRRYFFLNVEEREKVLYAFGKKSSVEFRQQVLGS